MTSSTTLIIIIAFIVIGTLLFLKSKSSRSENKKLEVPYNIEEAKEFVKHLEEIGYFKYADAKDLDSLRQNMVKEYDPTSELVSIWDENLSTPKDYRYYFCDNETLFEEGGLTEMLKDMQPTFDKIGLQFKITNHFEIWDDSNKWLNHTITINGNKYTIFKNFTEMGWGEAAQRLAEILNKELEKQDKEDRAFLVSGGNDGRIIFITENQFTYIDSVYKNKYWKPLRVKDWCQVMQSPYMHVD
jgi:hypothetical protein